MNSVVCGGIVQGKDVLSTPDTNSLFTCVCTADTSLIDVM